MTALPQTSDESLTGSQQSPSYGDRGGPTSTIRRSKATRDLRSGSRSRQRSGVFTLRVIGHRHDRSLGAVGALRQDPAEQQCQAEIESRSHPDDLGHEANHRQLTAGIRLSGVKVALVSPEQDP